MNYDILKPDHILRLWLAVAIMIIAELVIQFYPYLNSYPKDQCELREFTLTSFKTEIKTRHSVKYSNFEDANGNVITLRSTAEDHIGRKTNLYVYDTGRGMREKMELKYISFIDIVVVLMFLMMLIITVLWLINRGKRSRDAFGDLS